MANKVTGLALKILAWFVVPLICVDVLLVVLDFPQGLLEYDPDLGFRARVHYPTPDGGLTKAYGFNDRDYPPRNIPGAFRVLVVGDSFSWVGGREGNYTKVLERKFETHHGSYMIDFINAGYPMTHTGEQLAMLKKFGPIQSRSSDTWFFHGE